jgi:hypothetical protein
MKWRGEGPPWSSPLGSARAPRLEEQRPARTGPYLFLVPGGAKARSPNHHTPAVLAVNTTECAM